MEEWTLQKLNSFIQDEVEENLNLDYKSAGALEKNDRKRIEISKDVSSFANSAGGIIIYGISEYNEKEKSHLPEKLSPIDRVKFPKEWLERVINSNISPKVPNVKIHSIEIRAAANEVAYVVEIPQSITAHQAKDKRYYKRYNFESTPMDDYEVKDIINRANKTDIEIRLILKGNYDLFDRWIKNKTRFTVSTNIMAYNAGNLVTKHLELFICGDSQEASMILEPNIQIEDDFQIRFNNEKERKISIQDDEFVIGVDRLPILPNNSFKLGQFKFNSDMIFNDMELTFLLSTEDSNRTIVVKGIELMDVIK